MRRHNLAAMQAATRAHVLADTLARALRWLLWGALVLGIVAPLVLACWREVGPLRALLVAALLLGACAQVAPQGASLARRVHDIGREYPDDD